MKLFANDGACRLFVFFVSPPTGRVSRYQLEFVSPLGRVTVDSRVMCSCSL